MPKMVHFDEFLKTWILRSNSVTRQSRTKNWNHSYDTFLVIFKHCGLNSFSSISRFLKCFDTFDQTPSARRRSWLFTREGCVHHIRSSVIALTFFWLENCTSLASIYFKKKINCVKREFPSLKRYAQRPIPDP